MPHRPRIALLIESSRAYGRGVLRGISAYSRTHGPWSIFHEERSIDDAAPDWLENWEGDGIIARIESRRLLKRLRATGAPIIDVRGRFDLDDIPLVETNDRKVTRLAVDHLLERGFRRLAYCGVEGANYSERRLSYYREYAKGHNIEPLVFQPAQTPPASADTVARERWGMLHEEAVVQWIDQLPKPIGVMACNDIRGRQVLNACRTHGVAVPDDVAVIGVDNDETVCELADPPMSSVEPNTERIGQVAAELLDRMMQGQTPDKHKAFINPVGVVTRRSTDVLAIDDREIAQAVRYIRDHACDGISVEDVLDHVPLSRTTLDRRFNAAFGRTPKAEIVRVRVERVKQLLRETDYTLIRIADLAGFSHAEYLNVAFKQKVGVTPGKYRAQVRG